MAEEKVLVPDVDSQATLWISIKNAGTPMEEGDIISDPDDLCKYPSEVYDLHNLYVEEPWRNGQPTVEGLVWVVLHNPEVDMFSKPSIMKWVAEEQSLILVGGRSSGSRMKMTEERAARLWWKPLRVPAFPKNRAS